jgi:flagellar L-ring protein precursor FlgH
MRLIAVFLLMMVPAGCMTALEPSKIDREPFVISNTYKTPVAEKPATQPRSGSIWRGELTSLFGDQRARNIGDIVTVKIVEESSASEKATTDTSRKSEIDGGVTNFFGVETNPGGPFRNLSTLMKAGMNKNDFSGSGETKRSGSLTTVMAARVMEVLPNGNLAVEGKREIYVNNEKKEILLQGIVRPRDIANDNTIYSTQIADAKIIYTGIGVVAEKQRPGWMARIIDYVWPF